MTQVIQDVLKGSLVLQEVPERVCIESWRDLIEIIPQLIGVEIPNEVSGLVVGPNPPGEDDINKLWLRRDNSGNVEGLYAFQNGSWQIIYNIINEGGNQEIRWIVGNSANAISGWEVITADDPILPAAVAQKIVAEYVPSGTPGVFNYFAVRYVGF
jgi:hypothetical protein